MISGVFLCQIKLVNMISQKNTAVFLFLENSVETQQNLNVWFYFYFEKLRKKFPAQRGQSTNLSAVNINATQV